MTAQKMTYAGHAAAIYSSLMKAKKNGSVSPAQEKKYMKLIRSIESIEPIGPLMEEVRQHVATVKRLKTEEREFVRKYGKAALEQ